MITFPMKVLPPKALMNFAFPFTSVDPETLRLTLPIVNTSVETEPIITFPKTFSVPVVEPE
jgi:hypothetical protein